MKFCPTCGHTNDQTALYCEACGVVLDTNPSLSNATERSSGYEVAGLTPPPPPPYTPPDSPLTPTNSAASSYYTQPLSSAYTPHRERAIGAQQEYWQEYWHEEVPTLQYPKRTVGRLTINSILYLCGILCSAFGASGLLLQGSSSTLIGVVFMGYCLVGVVLLVPILIAHKRLILRTRIRIVSIVVAIIAAGLMTLISAGILSGPQHEITLEHFLGIIFIVCGIVISIVAVL
jgi:hypothetical protein